MVPAQGPYSIPHVLWSLSTMGHRIINYFWPFGPPDIILPVAFQCFLLTTLITSLINTQLQIQRNPPQMSNIFSVFSILSYLLWLANSHHHGLQRLQTLLNSWGPLDFICSSTPCAVALKLFPTTKKKREGEMENKWNILTNATRKLKLNHVNEHINCR